MAGFRINIKFHGQAIRRMLFGAGQHLAKASSILSSSLAQSASTEFGLPHYQAAEFVHRVLPGPREQFSRWRVRQSKSRDLQYDWEQLSDRDKYGSLVDLVQIYSSLIGSVGRLHGDEF